MLVGTDTAVLVQSIGTAGIDAELANTLMLTTTRAALVRTQSKHGLEGICKR